jgi:hypothetical protein
MTATRVTGDEGVFKALRTEIEDYCRAKGWLDDGRTFGDEIALIVSEASEALEAYRDNGYESWTTYRPIVDGIRLPKMTAAQLAAIGLSANGLEPIREGVAPELAGLVIRILDACGRHDIDLWAEIRSEMDYNWRREFHHGGRRI